MKKIAVAGAGLTGSVIGYRLAHLKFEVELYESRDHLGGNCYSERDPKSGVMVHKYGAHIFHTDDENVWRFVIPIVALIKLFVWFGKFRFYRDKRTYLRMLWHGYWDGLINKFDRPHREVIVLERVPKRR